MASSTNDITQLISENIRDYPWKSGQNFPSQTEADFKQDLALGSKVVELLEEQPTPQLLIPLYSLITQQRE